MMISKYDYLFDIYRGMLTTTIILQADDCNEERLSAGCMEKVFVLYFQSGRWLVVFRFCRTAFTGRNESFCTDRTVVKRKKWGAFLEAGCDQKFFIFY